MDLRRDGDDKWLAGVCSGIATRLGVDPIVIRAVLVLLVVLGGRRHHRLPHRVGVPAQQPREIVAEKALRDGDVLGIILLVVIGLSLIGGTGLAGDTPGLGWIWWVVVPIGLVVWLVTRNRDGKPERTGTRQPPHAQAATLDRRHPATTAPARHVGRASRLAVAHGLGDRAGHRALRTRALCPEPRSMPPCHRPRTPPPCGHASRRHHFPPPTPGRPPSPRAHQGAPPPQWWASSRPCWSAAWPSRPTARRSRSTTRPTGPAATRRWRWPQPSGSSALGTLVLGLLGRRAGFTGFLAVVLALVTWTASVVPDVTFGGGIGERTWRPSATDTTERYRLSIGSAELDLADAPDNPGTARADRRPRRHRRAADLHPREPHRRGAQLGGGR